MASSSGGKDSRASQAVEPPGDDKGGDKESVGVEGISDWEFFLMLAVVVLIGFNEAYQVNCIWPFLPFMVEGFGVPEEDNATYVGMLASAFFLSQLCSSVLWGIASDKFGRRPCLLAGVALNGLAMVQFGFADTFPKAVLGRVLAGGLSGNVGITKTYMGEVAKGARSARAFSVLGLAWGAGSVLAPIAGGFLSNPTDKYPTVFPPDSNAVLVEYPYLLPSLTSTAVAVVAVVMGWLYLPETPAFLASHPAPASLWRLLTSLCRPRAQYTALSVTQEGDVELAGRGDGAPEQQPSPAAAPSGCCAAARSLPRETLVSICCYAGVAMTQILFDELMPVMAKTDSGAGGLGFDSTQVGVVLTIQGVGILVYQLLAYQSVVKWVGPVRLFTWSALILVPVTLLWPLTTLTAGDPVGVWAAVGVLVTVKTVAFSNLFTCVMMLINTSARDRAPLGTVNGVAQSASAGVRSASPFLGGLLFSASHALQWRLHALLAYALPALAMAATAALSITLPRWLDEDLGGRDPPAKEQGAAAGGDASQGDSSDGEAAELLAPAEDAV